MRGTQAAAEAPSLRAVTVTAFQKVAASWGLRVLAENRAHQAIFVPIETDDVNPFDAPAPYRITAFIRSGADANLVPHLTAMYGGAPKLIDEGALADFSGGMLFARVAAAHPNRPILREVPCLDDCGAVLEWTEAWKQALRVDDATLLQMVRTPYLPSVRWISAYAVEGSGEGVVFVLESTLNEGFADARIAIQDVTVVAAGAARRRSVAERAATQRLETRHSRFAKVLTRLGYLFEKLEHSLVTPEPSSSERPIRPSTGDSAMLEASEAAHLFLSHSSQDRALVDAMMDYLVRCIPALANAIVCTSSIGCDYPIGEDITAALTRDIASARVVVGLITENSLNAEWPLFEMYNAVGQKKRVCFVLGPGMGLERVPTPLKSTVMKNLDDMECMPNLVARIARLMHFEVNAAAQVPALTRFFRSLPPDG